MKYKVILSVSVTLLFVSCNTRGKKGEEAATKPVEKEVRAQEKAKIDKAETLVAATIKAHGGELYDDAHFGFTFRKKAYSFLNKNGTFIYWRKYMEKGNEIVEVLENGKLTRSVNGTEIPLSEKDIAKYIEALNSVVYFATLPHKLKDRAVKKTYVGSTTIKGQTYDILGIGFDQEGGGVDFDDEFHYWINTETKTVDYLAYSYSTNEGGVRFRSAYNPRTVGGIRFQDYVNYEAPIGTPLKDLPALYEKGALKELSKIITEDVVDLDN